MKLCVIRPALAVVALGLVTLGASACGGTVAGGASTDAGPSNDAPGLQDAPVSQNDGPSGIVDSGSMGADGHAPFDAGPPPTDSGSTCQSPDCVPPPPPGNPSPTPSSAAHDYAIHKLYLGDTDRAGVSRTTAWESYGYDLDGLATTQTSTNVCTLAAGASKATQNDGLGGIDNSFGENIVPILLATGGSQLSADVDTSLQSGAFTDLIYTVGFDDQADNTTTATGLTGVLLRGANYPSLHNGAPPTWDLTTHWPIAPESLVGCPGGVCPPGTNPIASAAVQFPAAYQKGGTFVNGTPGLVALQLNLGGAALPFLIHAGVLTFQPQAPGSVTNGVVAGALDTTELIAAFHVVAGTISTSLCSGSAFNSIAQQLAQASDILYDAATGAVSNSPGTACNAISIGLGFDATEVAVPAAADVTGPTPAAPNPCGDQ